ncbi:unnamed protein product [Rhodiola kirilowii]
MTEMKRTIFHVKTTGVKRKIWVYGFLTEQVVSVMYTESRRKMLKRKCVGRVTENTVTKISLYCDGNVQRYDDGLMTEFVVAKIRRNVNRMLT